MVKKGFKLFRILKSRPGEIFPLYVNADQSVPFNKWLDASCGPMTEDGKVRSRLGNLKYRPGWHINDLVPYVSHIGIKENGKITYMREDCVWCEVEYKDDVDYCLEAKNNGYRNGKFSYKDACLDKIPVNGFYRYKTSPTMTGEWIIAGNMRVVRVLTDEEVKVICNGSGIEPLPRKHVIDFREYGFTA